MTNQPRLNQPRAVVLEHALTDASWHAGESLLLRLHLASSDRPVSADGRQQLRDAAYQAATDLHDYAAMLGWETWAATVIDRTVKISPQYAPHHDEALALVAEIHRRTSQPKRRAA